MEEEDAANLQSFLRWAAELGISDSPITQSEDATRPSSCLGRSLFVSHFPDSGGRGLAAARDIRKGELILRVPKGALMSSDSLIMKDQRLFAAVKRHHSLSSTQVLAVALLNEVNKGKSSWWYPYLKQLPRSYDLLTSFNQFETQALQMDDAIWVAKRAAEKAKLEWEEASVLMVELKLKPELQTLNAWIWCSATVSSRTMHIPWDDAGCLCPVGDFFNYAAPGEETCESESLGTCGSNFPLQIESLAEADDQRLTDADYQETIAAYCFYARRNYQAKEQVLLSYGMYTNLELLEHYGFLLNDNPNDKAFILLEPDMYSLCSWSKELLYINQDGKPSFALLSALRLWATPPNKRRSVGHFAYTGEQLSEDNEVSVMRWLAKKCDALLENLMTSVEQDKLLLNFIDKIQDFLSPAEIEKLPLACYNELHAFLKSNGMTSLEDYANAYVTWRVSSVFRWKLAVLWRFNYKKRLGHCIRHCTETIDNFSPS